MLQNVWTVCERTPVHEVTFVLLITGPIVKRNLWRRPAAVSHLQKHLNHFSFQSASLCLSSDILSAFLDLSTCVSLVSFCRPGFHGVSVFSNPSFFVLCLVLHWECLFIQNGRGNKSTLLLLLFVLKTSRTWAHTGKQYLSKCYLCLIQPCGHEAWMSFLCLNWGILSVVQRVKWMFV